ncbi:MAG: SocA family protein [Rubellimicrobium sp.]|nr:SocA family protein [Rubellimicrobium sp.]
MSARYRFSAAKAFHAIHWMTRQGRPVDLHTALKAAYFADRGHLNEHLQPIFGATYKAMKSGPVPLEIYEMIKGEALWLSELHRVELPWRLDGFHLRPHGNEPLDMDEFAESERQHLESGFSRSTAMTFDARTAATHGADWQAANGGIIRYEDMVDERPDRPAVIEYLQDTARHMRL